MNRLIAVLALSMLLVSCASQIAKPDLSSEGEVMPEALLHDSPIESAEIDFSGFNMLQMSPEMVSFLDENVRSFESQSEQLRRLAWAIMRSGDFSLAYADTTGTASETFLSRRGNCMGFTNMFVALTRDLGIDAYYQEVDVPPSWSMSGDSFLYSQHINVFVDLKQGRFREVDFNIYDFDHEMEARIISDERALAHYFNNIGAEYMLNGDTGQAYAYLRESLMRDASFASAWINLGILHRKEGLPKYAEVAFLEALRHDRVSPTSVSDKTLDVGWMPSRQSDTSLVAMSNLANLYAEQGEFELAEQYFNRVHSHRLKNPYYRYQMAEQAFEEGDYASAIEDLKFAVRRRNNEDRFYYLLSLCYMMQGDREEAREWMKKAEQTAQDNSEKERYHYKLGLLYEMNGN